MLPVERADERVPLEDDRRVPEPGPVVFPGSDGPVEQLGRVDREREARLAHRHAVQVLVVERPQVGELHQRCDGRKARVGRAKLEALDLVGLGSERRPRQLLGDGERRAPRPRLELLVAEPLPSREREDHVRPRREGRQLGAGAGQVDHRFLLVERALLGGKVETGEHDDAVQPVRAPHARSPLGGEGRTAVGPHARLDCVEHVGDPHRLAPSNDVDTNAFELGHLAHELRPKRRKLPGHQAARPCPSRAETSTAVAAHSSPTAGRRGSVRR